MIWLEKYRPQKLDEIYGHDDTIRLFKSFNSSNMPHIIIHGISGVGKKTLVLSFINNFYNVESRPAVKTIEIKNNTKTIEVSFLESNEYIEINPSSYGYMDKLVIQHIVKEMAQYKPVMSFFAPKSAQHVKIIVISSAHELTNEAQAALRRTIEIYSNCFRLILICSNVSNIIEPIRSRCMLIRLPGSTNDDIKKMLVKIIAAEDMNMNEDLVNEIIKASEGSMKRAVSLLELYNIRKGEGVVKRQKTESQVVKFDWQEILDDLFSTLYKGKTSNDVLDIRKKLFLLLNSCIPAKTVIYEIYKRIVKCAGDDIIKEITDQALIYEERIQVGMKSIYHIEAFIVKCMQIIHRK